MGVRGKGQAEITEILLTMVMAAGMILAAMQIPRMVDDMATLLMSQSAEGMARDLSGMISISGAAMDEASITYQVENDAFTYDMTIRDRMLEIQNIYQDDVLLKGASTPLQTGYGKICIDPDVSFNKVNHFVINKVRGDTCDATVICDTYDVIGR